MPVVGDFKRLERLVKGADKLGRGSRRELHDVLAERSLNLVEDCFNLERDPYGEPWKETRRGGNILRDTGRLLAGRFAVATATGFTIEFSAVYAAVHNFGAVIEAKNHPWLTFRWGRGRASGWARKKQVVIPRRTFVPTDELGGLGPVWTDSYQETINVYIAELFK